MTSVTIKISDQLHARIRRHAGFYGKSLSGYLQDVLSELHSEEAFKSLLVREGFYSDNQNKTVEHLPGCKAAEECRAEKR